MNSAVTKEKALVGAAVLILVFLLAVLVTPRLFRDTVPDLNGKNYELDAGGNRSGRFVWLHPGQLLFAKVAKHYSRSNEVFTFSDVVVLNLTNGTRRSLSNSVPLLNSKFACVTMSIFARDGWFLVYGAPDMVSTNYVCLVGSEDGGGSEKGFYPCKRGLVEQFWVPGKKAWVELTYFRSETAKAIYRDWETTNSRVLNLNVKMEEALGFRDTNVFLSLNNYPNSGKLVDLSEWNLTAGTSRVESINLPHEGPADALLSPSGTRILWRFRGGTLEKLDGKAGGRYYSEFWVSSSKGENFQPIGKAYFNDSVEVSWAGNDNQFAVIERDSMRLVDVK